MGGKGGEMCLLSNVAKLREPVSTFHLQTNSFYVRTDVKAEFSEHSYGQCLCHSSSEPQHDLKYEI